MDRIQRASERAKNHFGESIKELHRGRNISEYIKEFSEGGKRRGEYTDIILKGESRPAYKGNK